jgi:hypothetical protein
MEQSDSWKQLVAYCGCKIVDTNLLCLTFAVIVLSLRNYYMITDIQNTVKSQLSRGGLTGLQINYGLPLPY